MQAVLPMQATERVSLDESKLWSIRPKGNAVILRTMLNAIVTLRLIFR